MNKNRIVLFALLLAMPSLISPPPTSASILVHEQGSLSFVLFDQCNGEFVQVSGEFERVISSKENNDGTMRLRVHYNAHGQAVGLTSGCRYIFKDKFTQTSDQSAVCGFTFELTRTQRLVSQGAYPNRTLRLTLNVSQDEDCVVTTSSNQTIGC